MLINFVSLFLVGFIVNNVLAILGTVFAVIIIFSLLVLIHECGHFFAAKRVGIKVEEFGMGLPPRIGKGWKYGDTLYSFNWIPFGGFVRLYGEDGYSKRLLIDRKSFLSKTKWQRTQVILAGVVMNFILAFFLIWAGFVIGMEPLYTSYNDLIDGVKKNDILVESGIVIKEVKEDSYAAKLGVLAGDKVIRMDGEGIEKVSLASFVKGKVKDDFKLDINRDGKTYSFEFKKDDAESLGFKVKPLHLPVLKIDSLNEFSRFRKNDEILEINGIKVSAINDGVVIKEATVLRNGDLRKLYFGNALVVDKQKTYVKINEVLEDSVAESFGLQGGDIVLAVYKGDQKIHFNKASSLVSYIGKHKGNGMNLEIMRGDKQMSINIPGFNDKYLGISLIDLMRYDYFSLVEESKLHTIMDIKKIKLPILTAFTESIKETGRISLYTVKMFGNVLKTFVSSFDVPAGVAGPVGIVKLTSIFMGEGIVSLMRFVALLSLSLGVINLLPIPALDGGRFLFIIVEAITGKKVDPKMEAKIHGVGFVFLMLLIFVVTISDIKNLIF